MLRLIDPIRRPWREMALFALFTSSFLFGIEAVATSEPPGLFTAMPGKSRAILPEQAIEGRARAVKINQGRLRSGRFFVSLPGDLSFEAVRDTRYELGKGRSAWVGHASGRPGDRVVIGTSGDAVAATFAIGDRLFKLEPRADGSHVVSEVDPSDPAPGADPIPVDSADTTGAAGRVIDSGAAADGGPIIDVLVAYTPRVQSIYGAAGTEALVVQAVAEANQAYANSGINQRLNLVDTVLTNYVESGSMITDLSRLRGTSDGYMDELHALRDSTGADMVSLIENEPQYCGYAYIMNSLSSSFASSAFSVVHRTCATGYYSFAHELGHNQGANHDTANAGSAMYPYAYGYQEPYNAFRTVMAYNCSGGCRRVDQFSNPDVLYGGQPTGILGAADNALTLNRNAATVASFRQVASQVTAPAAPSSLNAAATGPSAIQLAWADNASDESGFRLERATDGGSYSVIASLNANTSAYLDDSLTPDTIYNYRVRAWNSAGNSGYSNVATAVTETAPPDTEQVASSDLAVAGTVSGTYQDTWADDNSYQTITERLSGYKKNGRYAYLEHKWRFQVIPGNAVVFSADAETTASNDYFTFAYSTDNSQFISMFSIDSSTSGAQTFMLPSSISGAVYIRVRDKVRSTYDASSHSVKVDHLSIRSENGEALPLPTPPQGVAASTAGTDSIDIAWTDTTDYEQGFDVERRLDGSSQWQVAGTAQANTRSFLDTRLQPGKLYHYRVSAFNSTGSSAYSDPASARTEEQAAAPLSLLASGYKVRGKHSVSLSWSGASSSRVDIYRNGQKIAGSISNDSSYKDIIGAKGGASYSYELCEANTSTCSNTANVVL